MFASSPFHPGKPPPPPPPAPFACESPSLADGKPSWSREENGSADLVRSADPPPGKEKVSPGIWELEFVETVAVVLNPRLLPDWAAFQKESYFIKVWRRERRKIWQHSRNQHYYNTIASIFSLAFPNIEIFKGGEVEIKS